MESSNELGGLSSFFEGSASFVLAAERQYEFAGDQYVAYVVERLERCRENVSGILSHLQVALDRLLTSQDRKEVAEYIQSLSALLESLESMGEGWECYLDMIQCRNDRSSSSYQAAVIRHGRGPPRFDISKEQLLYLSSRCVPNDDLSKKTGVWSS